MRRFFDVVGKEFEGYESGERDDRLESFTQVKELIVGKPSDVRALSEAVRKLTVMQGGNLSSKLGQFFKDRKAHDTLEQLLGSPRRPPGPGEIDRFIDRSQRMGFANKDGKSQPSLSARLATVLLTSAFPDDFVYFLVNTWKWLALALALEHPESLHKQQLPYGELVYWAGKAVKDIAAIPVVEHRVCSRKWPDSWSVAGLIWMLSREDKNGKPYKEIFEGISKEEGLMAAKKKPGRVGTNNGTGKGRADKPDREDECITHLDEAGCVILQGPPGSGKTYRAEQVIKRLAGDDEVKVEELRWTKLRSKVVGNSGNSKHTRLPPMVEKLPVIWDIVQLHPGYAYEDLVRGLVTDPDPKVNGIKFKPQDRIVVELARLAEALPKTKVVLVLDEINRCNLASVLGELILLLEKSKRGKRDERGTMKVRLQYPAPSGDEEDNLLFLPDNFWILGTMNTADRSIAVVDYAIRRRFRFVDVLPDGAAINTYYEEHGDDGWNPGKQVKKLFDATNAVVKEPRLCVGHSYFLVKPSDDKKLENWADRLARRYVYEVLPLLREYLAEGNMNDRDGKIVVKLEGLHVPLEEAASGEAELATLVEKLAKWINQ